MDDKNNKEGSPVGNEKKSTTGKQVLLQSVNKLPEPSKIKQWYINYILSDFTFASLSTGILLMIKIYFNLPWERFWNGLALWYVVYIATMVARIVKTVCEHYKVGDKKCLN